MTKPTESSHPFSIKVDHAVAGTDVRIAEFVNAGDLGVVVFSDIITAADFATDHVLGFLDADDEVSIAYHSAAFAGPVVDGLSLAVDLA